MKTNKSVSSSRQPIKSGLTQNNLSDEELKAEFMRTRGVTVCAARKAANPKLKLAPPKSFLPASFEPDPEADRNDITAFNKRKSRRYSERETKRIEKQARQQAGKADRRRREKRHAPDVAKLNTIAAKMAEVRKNFVPRITIMKKQDIVDNN